MQPVASIRRATAQRTDERVRLASEAIQVSFVRKRLQGRAVTGGLVSRAASGSKMVECLCQGALAPRGPNYPQPDCLPSAPPPFILPALQGALACKMLGWEDPLAGALRKLRGAEASQVARMARIRACNMALQFIISCLVTFATFAVYRARGGELAVASVFFSLSLLQLPRRTMSSFVSGACLGVRVLKPCTLLWRRLDFEHACVQGELPSAAAQTPS